jgi:hypothetical protein
MRLEDIENAIYAEYLGDPVEPPKQKVNGKANHAPTILSVSDVLKADVTPAEMLFDGFPVPARGASPRTEAQIHFRGSRTSDSYSFVAQRNRYRWLESTVEREAPLK